MNLTGISKTLLLINGFLVGICVMQYLRQSQDPILREAAGDSPRRLRMIESGGFMNWYKIWEDTETGTKYLETGHGTVKLDNPK